MLLNRQLNISGLVLESSHLCLRHLQICIDPLHNSFDQIKLFLRLLRDTLSELEDFGLVLSPHLIVMLPSEVVVLQFLDKTHVCLR